MGKYTEEFKESIVNLPHAGILYQSGRSSGELMAQYGIGSSTFYKWVRKYSEVRISETETVSISAEGHERDQGNAETAGTAGRGKHDTWNCKQFTKNDKYHSSAEGISKE